VASKAKVDNGPPKKALLQSEDTFSKLFFKRECPASDYDAVETNWGRWKTIRLDGSETTAAFDESRFSRKAFENANLGS